MNLPTRAQDAHAALAAAFNTGDVNTVLSMYDYEGLFIAEPDKVFSGKEQFEEVIKSILALNGKMEIKTVYCMQTGDLAVGRSEWSVTVGEEVKIQSKGIELIKKQADGTWKVLIDHACGALEELTA